MITWQQQNSLGVDWMLACLMLAMVCRPNLDAMADEKAPGKPGKVRTSDNTETRKEMQGNLRKPIAQLIKQLDDDEFKKRVAATVELSKRGKESLNEIDNVFLHSSLEAQSRMMSVLAELFRQKETKEQAKGILEKISKSKSIFAGAAEDIHNPYPNILKWLKELNNKRFAKLTLRELITINELDLSETEITNEDLRRISSLTFLTKLDLMGTVITDQGLKELRSLVFLTQLDLMDTGVTGQGLKGIISLTQLNLTGSAITDQGLNSLNSLTSLTQLNLGATSITDKGLKELGSLTSLTQLNLELTDITDQGLKELGSLTSLTQLNLLATNITDQGLKELRSLSSLTQLTLSANQHITDQGFKELQKALPNCKIRKQFSIRLGSKK